MICPAYASQAVRDIAQMREGGYTGGGGDFDGEVASRSLWAVLQFMSEQRYYAAADRSRLIELGPRLRILVVDKALPARVGGITQNGAAYSEWVKEGANRIPAMTLQRTRWMAIGKALDREALIHHELCVLAGLEVTGDYHLTNEFVKQRQASRNLSDERAEICTLSLFTKKVSLRGKELPDRPLGTGAIVMEWMGMRGGRVKIGDIDEHREVRALYVIGSDGYLRLKLYESDHLTKAEEFSELYKNETLLKDETVLFDPYGDPLYPGVGAKNIVLDRFFLTVSCTRQ